MTPNCRSILLPSELPGHSNPQFLHPTGFRPGRYHRLPIGVRIGANGRLRRRVGRDCLGIGARILALSIGGALGVNARFWLAAGIDRWVGPRWPWATFAINVSGSFAIGVAATLLARRDPHQAARLVVITGFLGGYTTFSTFAFEARALWGPGPGGIGGRLCVGERRGRRPGRGAGDRGGPGRPRPLAQSRRDHPRHRGGTGRRLIGV